MATEIRNKQFKLYDKKQNLPTKNIYVETAVGIKSLNELFVYKINEKPRTVVSLQDFINNYNNLSTSNAIRLAGRISNSIPETEYSKESLPTKKTRPVFKGPFYKAFDIPKYHESTTILPEGEKSLSGYKKFLKVNENDFFNENNYVMVFVGNSSKPKFLLLSDIYYYSSYKRETLAGKSKSNITSIVNTNKKDLFARDGQTITGIYTDKTFSFKALKEETFNPKTLEKTEYTTKIDKNGNPTFEEKVIKLDNKFATQSYVKRMIDDDKYPGKVKERSMVEIKRYEYSANRTGEYINVVLQNERVATTVKIVDLFSLSGEAITLANLNSFVGQRIKVKIGEKEVETEPLTQDQVTLTYNTTKNYIPSTNRKEDALTENSYLLLKDKTFVKETVVAKPIAYNFVKNNQNNVWKIYEKTKNIFVKYLKYFQNRRIMYVV